MESKREQLRILLWAAIGALGVGAAPFWSDGFALLLHVIVTVAALYALMVLGTDDTMRTTGLVGIAIVFNPIIPFGLPPLFWIAAHLGAAWWLWSLVESRSSPDPPPAT